MPPYLRFPDDPAGVNAKALQTFMGHANISITLDRYGHLMPGSGAEGHGCLMPTSAHSESGTKKPPARLVRCLLANPGPHETAGLRL